MEVPITRPSMVSYADEVNFAQLLEKLLKNRHNGFIRVTAEDSEGYILFKDGKQTAAEYDRFSKSQAIKNIVSVCEDNKTLIEVFDLKPSHIDYLLEVNKPFIIEPGYDVYKIIDELKSTNTTGSTPQETQTIDSNLKPEPTISEDVSAHKSEIDSADSKLEPEEKLEPAVQESESSSAELEILSDESELSSAESDLQSGPVDPEPSVLEVQQTKTESVPEPETESKLDTDSLKSDPVNESEPVTESDPVDPSLISKPEPEVGPVTDKADSSSEPVIETKTDPSSEQAVETETTTGISPETEFETSNPEPEVLVSDVLISSEDKVSEDKKDTDKLNSKSRAALQSKESLKKELKTMESGQESEIEPQVETKQEPMDRSKLMEKYGIKEMNEEDVEGILDDYKGGSISDDDVEKIEFSLMNKIKKSIFGIPKIKGAEVMVFLENSTDLTGDVNIIIEYEAKGFLSRIMGESKDIDNLRRQIINIVQIEIKKSFRKYPEIVSNFNINVEIN